MLTRTDATYDDGEIKFHVGCSFTTNIEGNNKFVGISSVGLRLCDPAVNDWRLATHSTSQLIAEFERQNPGLTSLRELRKSASLAAAEKSWDTTFIDRWTKVEFPLSEEQANQFLKKKQRMKDMCSNCNSTKAVPAIWHAGMGGILMGWGIVRL